MSYEVVKTIAGREYRYRVQSERDPQSGKTRNRWTYIGRVASERQAGLTPARRNARLRLLEAMESLLAAGDASALTIDAIARAAGVAHGTFYRHFQDRSVALEALARHIRERRAAAGELQLPPAPESPSAARAGVRLWALGKLRSAREHAPSLRAWHALVASDRRLAAYRDERRGEALDALREHLVGLCALRFASVRDPAATAEVLIALLDGLMRSTLLEEKPLEDARIEAAADAVERAIFAGRD